ncbi:glycosyltransferase family 2 protein [Roseospira navarrensis]|uniref:Glycosyltransferase n=1 Tax=Roseospira navarrensis TaxID=140058 RepID=A0A7X1ZF09_9PROT|nr:glycosyltransferase family 2 protein [Roseospira navarrensis]MQX36376.1 glycosyltransferase [Roseospira navarrensis]
MPAPHATGGPARPVLSVVTVTWNAAATLERTIESVLGQTVGPIDYVVVDGGSTDGTLDILRAHGDAIRWVSEPDRGIYDAMNKGIARARGDWIHLLNADDRYTDPTVLAQVLPRLDPNRTNYCDLIREHADGGQVLQRYRLGRWPLYFSAFLPHPSLIVSRAQYDRVGRYDPGYRVAADHDMILRLLRRHPAHHIPVPLTVMGQQGVSATDLETSLNEFSQVVRKAGVPAPLVAAMERLKRVWWGVRSGGG